MQFKDIPGHISLKSKLISSVSTDKVAQALMFLGPEGNGSLSLALAYAQYLNCAERSDSDSCGTCSSCSKSSKRIHPDIHFTYPVITKKAGKAPVSTDFIEEWRQAISENAYMNAFQWLKFIGAENKQGNITVDECKEIIRNQSLKAYEASFKVQIIWMAEHLKAAGNVLLKIIEEPPPRTVFILIVEQQEQILNTILSRTQVIKVPKLADQDIKSELIKNIGVPENDAERISRLANGNMNAAIQLFEDEDSTHDQLLIQWLEIIIQLAASNDRKAVVDLSNWKEDITKVGRENQKIFLKYVLFFLRESLMISMGQPSQLKDGELNIANQLAKKVSFDQIAKLSEMVNQTYYYVERNANPRILFFNTSLRMARIMSGKSLIEA